MNDSASLYSKLLKPTWAPPPWLFGPVWSVLYIIIFMSFGFVFYKVFNKQLPLFALVPFVLNLIFNLSFTYFQFGLKSNILAAIDIVLVLVTLVWALVYIYPHVKWVALVNIPYLLWVMFATVLQLTITFINR